MYSVHCTLYTMAYIYTTYRQQCTLYTVHSGIYNSICYFFFFKFSLNVNFLILILRKLLWKFLRKCLRKFLRKFLMKVLRIFPNKSIRKNHISNQIWNSIRMVRYSFIVNINIDWSILTGTL